MRQLKFIDFCAGIGGGRVGLEKGMNAKCIGFSEIMSASEKTYRLLNNSYDEENYGDLTKINPKELPDFDILIAGFPCQSFSIVGKRKGFDDDRGQIIYYLIDILKGKNIPYFMLENVKGLINHDRGNTLKTIMKLLDEAGYYTEYKLISSAKLGIPQIRERVYFIGIRKDLIKDKNKKFAWPEDTLKLPKLSKYLCDTDESKIFDHNGETFQRYLTTKYNKGKRDIDRILKEDYLVVDTRQSDLREFRGVVPTLRTGRHGILYVKDGKFRKLSGLESLLLQGFDKDKSKKVSQDKTILESKILSQAGNAMTVTVIEKISRKLLEYINENQR